MKNFLSILASIIMPLSLLVSISSCTSENIKQEDIALQTAKAHYDQLIAGQTQSFLEGTLKGDALPEDYKEQLLLNLQMYIETQQKIHGGFSEVIAVRATCDTTTINPDSLLITAQSTLMLCFKDSTKEEIVVPMVRSNNTWYMQ